MVDLVTDGDKAFVNGELNNINSYVNGDSFVQKSSTRIETLFLHNAYEKLVALCDTGFVPDVLSFVDYTDTKAHLITKYLGKSEPVTDEIEFRRNCAFLLWTLKMHDIRHGDITTKNIIVKNNKPMLVDFQQSKFDYESGPDKRPEGDAYWMWESALELSPDTSRHIRKWRAIRPFLPDEGAVDDLGCAEGDYCLFVQSEQKHLTPFGYDKNCNNIDFAKQNFGEVGFFECVDLQDEISNMAIGPDVAFLLSVYPYMVQDYGRKNADSLVKMCVRFSDQFFFETQLYGDGPGPEFFKTDDDVYKFLKQFGEVKKLVTIPVFGREPLARSVWRIT